MSDDFDYFKAATEAAQEAPGDAQSDPAPTPAAKPAEQSAPSAPAADDGEFDYFKAAAGDATPAEPVSGVDAGLAKAPAIVNNPFTRAVIDAGGMQIKIGEGLATLKNGVIQSSLDGLAKMGIIDEKTVNDWTHMTNEEKAKFDRQFAATYGDQAAFHVAEAGAEILPAFYLPQTVGKTVATRIAAGAGIGAAVGAAGYQTDENATDRNDARAGQGALGALFGTGAGAVLETLTSLRNWIPKAIDKAKAVSKDLAEGIDVQSRTGVLYKLSQIVQDPWVERMEKWARSGDEGERAARAIEDAQPKQILDYFEKMTAKPVGPQEPFGNRVARAYDTIVGDSTKGTGLLGARRKTAEANFAAAEKAGGLITVANFLGDAQKLIKQNSGPGAGASEQRMAKELQRIVDDVVDKTGGVMRPADLQRRLAAWGDAAKGTGKVLSDAIDTAAERGPAKMLFSALNRDLDSAIGQGGKGAAELRAARDAYAADTAKLNALRESALGSLFNVKGTPRAADIEEKFLGMDPDEIRSTMKILKQTDGAIHDHLQTFWLDRALQRAKIPGEAGATEFIPARLLDLKSGGKGSVAGTNRETFDAVFMDPAMRKQVETGIKAVQQMMVNNFRTSGRTVARMKNLANVGAQATRVPTSESPVTQAVHIGMRWAADVLAPKHLSRYLLDPAGVKALTELAANPNDARAAAALATLSNIALRGEPESQQPENQIQPQPAGN